MEDTVLSLRIVTTSAVFLALAAGSVSAQTATTTAPGKPLPLLQVFQKSEDTAVAPLHRVRHARRRATGTRVANHTTGAMRHTFMEVKPDPVPPETTQATTMQATTTTPPASIWPTPDLTLPGMEGLTPTPAAVAPVASEPAAPVAPAYQNEVLAAAYHTVQVAPQAAPLVTPPTAAQVTSPNTVQVAQANTVGPTDVAADAPHDAANTAKVSSPVASWPAQHVMVATAESQNPNPVGSSTWIAHVLAALGGAIAAGAVAWFLINPLPARSYE
jgi:hypothetical protein